MTSADQLSVQNWFNFGWLLLAIAGSFYGLLALMARSLLRGYSLMAKSRALIFHLPGNRTPPALHCSFGVIAFAGMSLIIAGGCALVFGFDFHLTVELSSLVFGGMIALTAFYTLWQTIRIEEHQGVMVEGFRPFIERVIDELEKVAKVADEDTEHAVERRVVIFTHNPYLGSLSFGTDALLTRRFRSVMLRLAELVRLGRIRLEVACGDHADLVQFHAKRIGVGTTQDSVEDLLKNPRVALDTRVAEDFLAELSKEAQSEVVRRLPHISTMQFIIIGDTLLEYLMTAQDNFTDVRRFRRSEDALNTKRFIEFFELFCHTRPQQGCIQV